VNRIRRALQLDRLHDDRGMALAIAIIFGMVIVVMVTSALAVSTSGLRRAATDQNFDGALSAAYAGIQDYQARLANDTTYQQYGNPDAVFSASSKTLLHLPTGTQVNKAFGIGTTGTWASVPGSSDSAQYRYEVDISEYANTGVIKVLSTGKVGTSVRSVAASVRQQGFIDFLYFTDYEIQDPQLSGAASTCVTHAWEGRGSGCSEIAFGGGDTINGPAHSNDTMRICDATFTQQVTTSSTTNASTGLRYTKKDSLGNGCSGQVFPTGTTQPDYASTIDMPATNTQQKRETRKDLAEVTDPGCLYTGPTDITFNANGTMTVKSPYTKATQTTGDASTGGDTAGPCGTAGTGSGKLGSSAGATVPVPDDNLVYVQNVPAASTDVNYTSTTQLKSTCNDDNHVGYPRSGETAPSLGTAPCAYGSRTGDAFVHGTLKGSVTVAAENYLYITGDMTYADASSDVLGLTATNAVWVWNPYGTSTTSYTCYFILTCSRSTTGAMLSDSNRTIDAAIISVAHTFQVQNYDKGGDRGTLTVLGAVAQKFRGIVRSGTNGYTKDYQYDPRLKYISPPKFLSPVTTTYAITTVAEVKPAFTYDGSAN